MFWNLPDSVDVVTGIFKAGTWKHAMDFHLMGLDRAAGKSYGLNPSNPMAKQGSDSKQKSASDC
jgi:hypothetical protein